jgi:anti-anti-sigma factor
VISDRELVTGAVIVVLPDEIDAVNAESLAELLGAAIVPGVTVVVADLTGTSFCDCAGINSLLLASRQASASNAELRLAVRSPAVLRILELTGADQVLRVYPDLAAALLRWGAAPPSARLWPAHPSPTSGPGQGGIRVRRPPLGSAYRKDVDAET